MLLQQERESIVEYGKHVSESGLCPGTSGNLSIFNPDLGYMAISPSGMDYFEIRAEDVVVTDLYANIIDGGRKPSSEWALHTTFYRKRPDARAIVHTHSIYCTTLGIVGVPIRAVHYVIGDAGTDQVPLAPYRLFGTEELAEEAIRACGRSHAVLLQNHGMLAYGRSLKEAYGLARNLEYVAELQYRAMSIGKPSILSPEQMKAVMEKFNTYGQPGKEEPDVEPLGSAQGQP